MSFIVINSLITVFFIVLLKINENKMTFSVIYLIYWWLFNAVGYLIYHNQYSFKIMPFLWIGGCVLSVVAGHYVGLQKLAFSVKRKKICFYRIREHFFSDKTLYDLFIAALALNLFLDFISLFRRGQIGMLFSPTGILAILNSNEVARATGTGADNGSIIVKLLGVLYCFLCILYGYTYHIKKIKESWIIKILFGIKILINVITSAGKFNIIAFIVMFTSGLITQMMRDRKLEFKNIKYGRLAIYIIAGGAVLFFLMNNRAGRNVGLSGLLAYGFGEIPSFNYWFTEGIHENTYGVQSFYGIVSHIKDIPFAEHEKNYPLALCAPDVNIFTMFRAVISDFGYFGGFVVLFLMGLSAGLAYRKLQTSGFANGWMAMLLGALFLGFLMPLGYYLTLFLGYVVFILFMYLYFNQIIEFVN